jgi:hypothetical protein
MIDLYDPHYLAGGNRRQRAVYEIVTELNILITLQPYNPVIAGTIPIDVDIEGSDIDILCGYVDGGEFENTLKRCYSGESNFAIRQARFREKASIVSSFIHGEYTVEIFGQMSHPRQQDGFVHMVVEHRILQMCTDSFREEVRRLKREGFGTEPAFARLLGISSDPYDALRDLDGVGDTELVSLIPGKYLKRERV